MLPHWHEELSMKRFILSLGVMSVLFGAMSSPLLAAGHGGGHSSGGHSSGHASTGHAVVHASTGHVAHAGVGHTVVHGNVGNVAMHGSHYGPGGYFGRDYRRWRGSYWD